MNQTLWVDEGDEEQRRQSKWRVIASPIFKAMTTLSSGVLAHSPAGTLARVFTVASALGALFCVVSTKHGADFAKSPSARLYVRAPMLPPVRRVDLARTDDSLLDSDFLPLRQTFQSGDVSHNSIRFGATRVQRSIVENVVEAARKTGADPALLMSIADKESNFSVKAKASTSSASGLFQFVEATWFRALGSFGGQHGQEEAAKAIVADSDGSEISPATRAKLLKLRDDPYLSAAMAAEMLQHDGAKISERLGRPLSSGETYLIHFLGPEDAARFMAKLDEAPQASAARLFPKPARANRPIFYEYRGGRMKDRSLQEVHEAFEHMMDDRVRRFQNVESRLPANASAYAE